MASTPNKGNKDSCLGSIDPSLTGATHLSSSNYASNNAYFVPTPFPLFAPSSSSMFRCPTLSDFLHQLNLTRYHNLFVDAGVGENDLEQLVGFDEAELKEVLEAITMKPFHSAAFKKGIRELRSSMNLNISRNVSNSPCSPYHTVPVSMLQSIPSSAPTPLQNYTQAKITDTTTIHSGPSPPRKKAKLTANATPISSKSVSISNQRSPSPTQINSANSTISNNDMNSNPNEPSSSTLTLINNPTVSREVIVQHATIYGKGSDRQLTQYEQAINQAAIELALADPALVANKGSLFEKAKAKLLLEGYTYKRGASRSKLNPHAPKPGQRASREILRQKRNANAAMTSESRNARITELERKLETKDVQYELAQEVKRTKEEHNDTAGVEKAQMAILELEKEREEIVKELSSLKGKERKHQWYEKRKKERMDSGFEEGLEDIYNEDEDQITKNDERNHIKGYDSSHEMTLTDERVLVPNSEHVKAANFMTGGFLEPEDRLSNKNSNPETRHNIMHLGLNQTVENSPNTTAVRIESGQQLQLF